MGHLNWDKNRLDQKRLISTFCDKKRLLKSISEICDNIVTFVTNWKRVYECGKIIGATFVTFALKICLLYGKLRANVARFNFFHIRKLAFNFLEKWQFCHIFLRYFWATAFCHKTCLLTVFLGKIVIHTKSGPKWLECIEYLWNK
jgi:hypothetical protein